MVRPARRIEPLWTAEMPPAGVSSRDELEAWFTDRKRFALLDSHSKILELEAEAREKYEEEKW